jgi:ubiquinone/menaquinone biosynthesis C-methylase UbiE
MTEQTVGNAQMQRYWNEVAGPRWVARQGVQEARNIEVADLLLAAARPAAGERVLDVGCGTGATALPFAAAVGPQGHVTGIDIAEPMLAVARGRVAEQGIANLTLLLADAQVHELPQASFDLLTSRFGVMFFADPVAAFRNLIGALRPGGRLCMAVWAPIADNPHWKIPYDIAVRRLGPPAPVSPRAPGPLAFSERGYLRDILEQAGFADIAVEPRGFHVVGTTAESEAEHAALFGPAQRLMDEKEADEATRRAVVEETKGAYAGFVTKDGVRLPGTVLLATGRRAS